MSKLTKLTLNIAFCYGLSVTSPVFIDISVVRYLFFLGIEVTPKFTQAQRNKMQCREAIKMSVRLCKSRSRANPIPIVHGTAAWAR